MSFEYQFYHKKKACTVFFKLVSALAAISRRTITATFGDVSLSKATMSGKSPYSCVGNESVRSGEQRPYLSWAIGVCASRQQLPHNSIVPIQRRRVQRCATLAIRKIHSCPSPQQLLSRITLVVHHCKKKYRPPVLRSYTENTTIINSAEV